MAGYNTPMLRRAGIAALIALGSCLLALLLHALGAVERLELITLDARYATGLGRKAPSPDIVIAWIDQESLDYMEREGNAFPWPREVYGQVLTTLRAAGARAVAFDILFDQACNTAADQEAFAKVLGEAPGDALAMKFVDYRDGGRNDAETKACADKALPLATQPIRREREHGVVLPLADFAAGAEHLGFVNIRADADGTFRRYDVLRLWGAPGSTPQAHPSLALAAALAAVPNSTPSWYDDSTLHVWGHDRRRNNQPHPAAVNVSPSARILLNLRGPAFTFAKVKFVNIFESILRADRGEPPLYPPETFRDKIVLVGIHAEGLEDAHPTPLDARLPGVELHATALDNLLAGDALAVPSWDAPLAVAAALLAAATVFALPGVVAPSLALLALAGIAVLLIGQAWLALLAVPVAAPALAGGTAAVGSFVWRLVVEGKSKREMHRAFRSYLAPEVLAEVLRDPKALRLGGETRDVTLFFTDLQGFTSLAEKTEPQQLVGFLNDYFTRMCAPVLAERGVIDKFIGDAIMAIFGAPASTPGHGAAAVRAAVQALAVSETIASELRARGLPPIATRIGIHRGTAVIGNMGSSSRFDYTAIGDTVNLAARLEGANKAFGTRCLVSETAWADVGDAVLGREVGRVTVVGRAEPIRVHEPLALRATANADVVAFTERWQQAMAAFARGDRSTTAALLRTATATRGDDALAAKWLAALADPGFQGVFALDHK